MVTLAKEFAPPRQNRAAKNALWGRVQVSGLRYYNPELGRWISRDPIVEVGSHVAQGEEIMVDPVILAQVTMMHGQNLWLSVFNDSVNNYDADGRAVVCATIITYKVVEYCVAGVLIYISYKIIEKACIDCGIVDCICSCIVDPHEIEVSKKLLNSKKKCPPWGDQPQPIPPGPWPPPEPKKSVIILKLLLKLLDSMGGCEPIGPN